MSCFLFDVSQFMFHIAESKIVIYKLKLAKS